MRKLHLATLVVAMSLAGAPVAALDSASAAPAECHGRAATIVSDGGTVTGTEGDDVISTTGAVSISALGGDDLICVSPGSGDIDGGAGADTLSLLGPPTDTAGWEVDLAGTVRRAGATVATFQGIETHSLDFGGLVAVEVLGTEGADIVEIDSGSYDAALGGGDDLLIVASFEPSGTIDAGDGRDAIRVLDTTRIVISLGRLGRVSIGGQSFGTNRFEDATVSASRIEAHGSAGVNTLVLTGCIVHGYGGGGADELTIEKEYEEVDCTRRNLNLDGEGGDDLLVGSNSRDVLSGGNGNDVLKGRRGSDELLGEAGGDKADGGGGRDTCAAEVKLKCEVKA